MGDRWMGFPSGLFFGRRPQNCSPSTPGSKHFRTLGGSGWRILMRVLRLCIAVAFTVIITACNTILPSAPYTQAVGVGARLRTSESTPQFLVNGCSSDTYLDIVVGNGSDPDRARVANLRINSPVFPVSLNATNDGPPLWFGNISKLDPSEFWIKASTESNGLTVGLFVNLPKNDTFYTGDGLQALGTVIPTTRDRIQQSYDCQS